jgi:hypothetical protein
MIKFTKDGRDIPLERFADELQNDITRAAREGIEERAREAVAALHCPVHGQAVREVRVEYDGGGDGEIRATPCCDAMEAEINRAIRAAFEEP